MKIHVAKIDSVLFSIYILTPKYPMKKAYKKAHKRKPMINKIRARGKGEFLASIPSGY